MGTDRVIQRRYLLQRLIQQGQTSAVYQAFDQVLQRAVAVKVTTTEHIPAYKAAIRATAQFAHPNIIGIYDLIVEPDTLYIVQEYVDGDNFSTLLRSQLSPYHVVEFGLQICQGLMYAGTSSRKVCHGDLTPAAIVRDRRGSVRINNFALPGDLYYFSAWNVIGGTNSNMPISDPELPVGQATDGRRADDTRAVGLLMYQLLANRDPNAGMVDPPADGRLHFLRNAPAEVCEVIARAVLRQHPQHILTPEALYKELKPLAEALEPPIPAVAVTAGAGVHHQDEAVRPQYIVSRTGQLGSPAFGREAALAQADVAPRADVYEQYTPESPTTADLGLSPHMLGSRPLDYPGAGYPQVAETVPPHRVNIFLLLLLGLVLFALFFGIGYYLSTLILK
ncbi:MAG TPA: protein kinase [Dictyobacter sp.]|nr:protein kinase [Dictyobacter sp.]